MLIGTKRFHKYHGSNVILSEDNTVACRKQSYANALVFSDSPLGPNDLFLVEIDGTERGWTGDMRIGLTRMNPHEAQVNCLELPQYALPDLSFMRPSWIYAISEACMYSRPRRPFLHSTSSSGKRDRLCSIMPSHSMSDRCATDVGSRIGLLYVPVKRVLELHFFVNGVDQGTFADDIPYDGSPLYVVVDVYGCTKKVRIIQNEISVPPLQDICRQAILQRIKSAGVEKLKLPDALKEYLLECLKDA